MNIKRVVPRDDKNLQEYYGDLMAKMPPTAVVVEDDRGVYRFKPNGVIRWAVDNGVDLNRMCMAYHDGRLSLEDYMEFYRGIGYSLSGFIEIFGVQLWPEEESEENPEEDDE